MTSSLARSSSLPSGRHGGVQRSIGAGFEHDTYSGNEDFHLRMTGLESRLGQLLSKRRIASPLRNRSKPSGGYSKDNELLDREMLRVPNNSKVQDFHELLDLSRRLSPRSEQQRGTALVSMGSLLDPPKPTAQDAFNTSRLIAFAKEKIEETSTDGVFPVLKSLGVPGKTPSMASPRGKRSSWYTPVSTNNYKSTGLVLATDSTSDLQTHRSLAPEAQTARSLAPESQSPRSPARMSARSAQQETHTLSTTAQTTGCTSQLSPGKEEETLEPENQRLREANAALQKEVEGLRDELATAKRMQKYAECEVTFHHREQILASFTSSMEKQKGCKRGGVPNAWSWRSRYNCESARACALGVELSSECTRDPQSARPSIFTDPDHVAAPGQRAKQLVMTPVKIVAPTPGLSRSFSAGSIGRGFSHSSGKIALAGISGQRDLFEVSSKGQMTTSKTCGPPMVDLKLDKQAPLATGLEASYRQLARLSSGPSLLSSKTGVGDTSSSGALFSLRHREMSGHGAIQMPECM